MQIRQIDVRVQQRIREIEHQIRLDQIREDGRRAVERILAQHAERRRREERFVRDSLERRLKWAHQDATRGKPLPLDLAERWHRVRIEQAGIVLPTDAEAVPRWRAHIVALCEQHQIEVRWEPAAAGINAYAWVTRKEIEIPPVTGPASYCVALHEIGHCQHPCDHRRVVGALGQSVCVPCELLAWSFAHHTAQPHWSRDMHTRMSQALTTYERYASEAERDEIRAMTSPLGFYQIRQERITQGVHG